MLVIYEAVIIPFLFMSIKICFFFKPCYETQYNVFVRTFLHKITYIKRYSFTNAICIQQLGGYQNQRFGYLR